MGNGGESWHKSTRRQRECYCAPFCLPLRLNVLRNLCLASCSHASMLSWECPEAQVVRRNIVVWALWLGQHAHKVRLGLSRLNCAFSRRVDGEGRRCGGQVHSGCGWAALWHANWETVLTAPMITSLCVQAGCALVALVALFTQQVARLCPHLQLHASWGLGPGRQWLSLNASFTTTPSVVDVHGLLVLRFWPELFCLCSMSYASMV
jgi:hypothetical protein